MTAGKADSAPMIRHDGDYSHIDARYAIELCPDCIRRERDDYRDAAGAEAHLADEFKAERDRLARLWVEARNDAKRYRSALEGLVTPGAWYYVTDALGIARRALNEDSLLPTPRTSDANGPGEHGDGGNDLRTSLGDLISPPSEDGSE